MNINFHGKWWWSDRPPNGLIGRDLDLMLVSEVASITQKRHSDFFKLQKNKWKWKMKAPWIWIPFKLKLSVMVFILGLGLCVPVQGGWSREERPGSMNDEVMIIMIIMRIWTNLIIQSHSSTEHHQNLILHHLIVIFSASLLRWWRGVLMPGVTGAGPRW